MKYAKALFAAVLAALGATQTAYTASGHIGYAAGITIAIATLTTLAVVFGVPNSTSEAPAPAAE
jgi:hypothetical protein